MLLLLAQALGQAGEFLVRRGAEPLQFSDGHLWGDRHSAGARSRGQHTPRGRGSRVSTRERRAPHRLELKVSARASALWLRSSAIEDGTQPLGVIRAFLELEQRDDLGPDQPLIDGRIAGPRCPRCPASPWCGRQMP
jgi:hypothetical protein